MQAHEFCVWTQGQRHHVVCIRCITIFFPRGFLNHTFDIVCVSLHIVKERLNSQIGLGLLSHWPFSLLNSARIFYASEHGRHQYGTCEGVKAKFWPWLEAENRENILRCCLFARKRSHISLGFRLPSPLLRLGLREQRLRLRQLRLA